MSENGRKRSRKSKLVPRDVCLDEESALEVQTEKKPKLLLKKLALAWTKPASSCAVKTETESAPPGSPALPASPASPVPAAATAPAPIQFSVKVEVEEFDEPKDEHSDYLRFLFNMPDDDDELSVESGAKTNSSTSESEKQCTLDFKAVVKMLSVLHKRLPDERQLVAYTRNAWGKLFHEIVSNVNEQCDVQKALAEWKSWVICSKTRETPFLYKCYVCQAAWWSLSRFQNHIKIHLCLKVQCEFVHSECNIIGFNGRRPEPKNIAAPGKCFKCAKSYEEHMASRTDPEPYYRCSYCPDKFQTCSQHGRHEGVCRNNPKRRSTTAAAAGISALFKYNSNDKKIEIRCKICCSIFYTKTEVEDHLRWTHAVRSDEPIVAPVKTCSPCGKLFSLYNFHVCPKKRVIHQCEFCPRRYQNKYMLECHNILSENMEQCNICNKFISKECMQMEHYVTHSDNFQMMYRCVVCKKIKVFDNEFKLKYHKSKYHSKSDYRRACDKILTPKFFLTECIYNPAPPKKRAARVYKKKAKLINKDDIFVIPKEDVAKLMEELQDDNDNEPGDMSEEEIDVCMPVVKRETDDGTEEPYRNVYEDEIYSETEIDVCAPSIKQEEHVAATTETNYARDKPDIEVNKAEILVQTNEGEYITAVKQEENTDVANLYEINTIPDIESETIIETEVVVPTVKIEKALDVTSIIPDEGINKQDSVPRENECVVTVKEEKNINEPADEPIIQMNGDRNIVFDCDAKSKSTDHVIESMDSKDKLRELVARVTAEMADPESDSDQDQDTRADTQAHNDHEYTRVFRVSKSVMEPEVIIKQEIKEEDEFCDDTVVIGEEPVRPLFKSDAYELDMLNLEPEMILKAGYRKRKLYNCSRCQFKGFHREYRLHVESLCGISRRGQSRGGAAAADVHCTKCGQNFTTMKRYAHHFVKHGYPYLTCPQCQVEFDSITKLVPHLGNHVKQNYVRIQLINDPEETSHDRIFQCKKCKKIVDTKVSFVHWERHLKLVGAEPPRRPGHPGHPGRPGLLGRPGRSGPAGRPGRAEPPPRPEARARALSAPQLRELLGLLQSQETEEPAKKIKTCIVCGRFFSRQNDCKRHLVEHLLEDAYTKLERADGEAAAGGGGGAVRRAARAAGRVQEAHARPRRAADIPVRALQQDLQRLQQLHQAQEDPQPAGVRVRHLREEVPGEGLLGEAHGDAHGDGAAAVPAVRQGVPAAVGAAAARAAAPPAPGAALQVHDLPGAVRLPQGQVGAHVARAQAAQGEGRLPHLRRVLQEDVRREAARGPRARAAGLAAQRHGARREVPPGVRAGAAAAARPAGGGRACRAGRAGRGQRQRRGAHRGGAGDVDHLRMILVFMRRTAPSPSSSRWTVSIMTSMI